MVTYPSTKVQILRGVTTLTTLLLIIFICLHYKNRLTFLIFKQRVELQSTLYSTNLLWPMIAEVIVTLIHSPPYMDNIKVAFMTTGSKPVKIDVDIDLIISCLVPCRIYLLFRYYAFYSSWADDRAEIICHESNATGGIKFAIKAELKERPYTTVGLLMIISILIFGYGIRNIEVAFMQEVKSNKFQDWRYIWNGFWCIIVTILTVGYGDYYPQTHLGRAIAVIACLWGTFLISLMVVSLTISVEFSSQEEKAYDEIKKENMYLDLRLKASTMIKNLHDLNNICGSDGGIEDPESRRLYHSALRKYKDSLNKFRKIRRYVLSQEHETSTENILHRLNQIVSIDLNELVNLSNHHVTNLMEYVKLSKNFQEEIVSYVEKLEKLTQGLHVCIKGENLREEVTEIVI